MKYCFYYDESEHSRVINLSTVTGETYYDGFLAAITGWRSDHDTAFEQRYHAFEEKYADRKKNGETRWMNRLGRMSGWMQKWFNRRTEG